MEKDKKSSKKAKKRTNAAESSPAARWARWRQEKEQDREIVIPRGPNLDESTMGEIPFVAASAEETRRRSLIQRLPSASDVSSVGTARASADDFGAEAHAASVSAPAPAPAPAVEASSTTERKVITVPEVEARPTSEPLHLPSSAASEPAHAASFAATREPQSPQHAPFDFSQVYAGAHAPRHAASTEAASEPSQEQGTEPLSATVLSSAAARARRRAAICVKALAVLCKPLLYPHAPYTPFLCRFCESFAILRSNIKQRSSNNANLSRVNRTG